MHSVVLAVAFTVQGDGPCSVAVAVKVVSAPLLPLETLVIRQPLSDAQPTPMAAMAAQRLRTSFMAPPRVR